MTELQLLIRDSNEMPPLIRADYLQDHGFDIEAERIRLNEWTVTGKPATDSKNVYGEADGFMYQHGNRNTEADCTGFAEGHNVIWGAECTGSADYQRGGRDFAFVAGAAFGHGLFPI
jgi:hypothetical protein